MTCPIGQVFSCLRTVDRRSQWFYHSEAEVAFIFDLSNDRNSLIDMIAFLQGASYGMSGGTYLYLH